MPTVIRMKRVGRAHSPHYRLVVVDSRAKATGKVIDEVGVYQPCARPEPKIEVNEGKALEWLGKGARPTTTARNVLSKTGVLAKFAQSKTSNGQAES